MATTSLSLGEQWEVYIKNEIASGRYGSAPPEFIDNFTMDTLINDLDNEA
jgi:hypothetical protein